ncbi:MAG: fibronectin type III domain-containing protein [Chthoniobacterales bacterium]
MPNSHSLGRTICALAFAVSFLSLPPLRAESIVRSITLAWNASTSADVVGYRVHYGVRSGQYPELIDSGNQTSCNIPNLVDGTTYFFAVNAYNAAGDESSLSDELTHTPNPGVLLNVSTRARVQDGDAVVIAGFIVGGSSRKVIIIRGMGPSLGASGLSDILADPMIELHGPTGLIATNDNWRDGNPTALYQFQLAPSFELEAALVVTLEPGSYTAIIRGNGGLPGIGLLEIYDGGIPAP